jgi:hypothetical protein
LKGAALNERSSLVRALAQLQFMATVVDDDESIPWSERIHTDEQSPLFGQVPDLKDVHFALRDECSENLDGAELDWWALGL